MTHGLIGRNILCWFKLLHDEELIISCLLESINTSIILPETRTSLPITGKQTYGYLHGFVLILSPVCKAYNGRFIDICNQHDQCEAYTSARILLKLTHDQRDWARAVLVPSRSPLTCISATIHTRSRPKSVYLFVLTQKIQVAGKHLFTCLLPFKFHIFSTPFPAG